MSHGPFVTANRDQADARVRGLPRLLTAPTTPMVDMRWRRPAHAPAWSVLFRGRPHPQPDELAADARTLLNEISAVRGEAFNVYRMLATSPAALAGTYALAHALWNRSALPVPLQETAIMRVALLTDSKYEWARHRPIARRAGIPDTTVAMLGQWEKAPGIDDTQRAMLRLADEIVGQGEASAATLEATTAPVPRQRWTRSY